MLHTQTQPLLFRIPLLDIIVERAAERRKQQLLLRRKLKIRVQARGKENHPRRRCNTRANRKFHPYDIEQRVRFAESPTVMMVQASSECLNAVEQIPLDEDSCFKQMLDFEESQQDYLTLSSWPSPTAKANADDTSLISSGFRVTREDFDRVLPTWHSMDGSAFDQPDGEAPWAAAEDARKLEDKEKVGPRFDMWAFFDQNVMAAFVRDDPLAVQVFHPVPVFTAE